MSARNDNDKFDSNKARDEGSTALYLRANTLPKADHFKRCRCHRNRGHSMEECNALKDKIKELIMLGHLKEFVHQPHSYKPEGRNGLEPGQGRD
ncbi:hypothetical protein JHK82_024171 [Glycine max]|nr:hypothetical protein JHK87_024130 [Glycine soja]KAG5011997.1 hypothetical protein JHK86_024258 [Glycine max]KAG5132983.1 hypothetical protein JHK82_024171 [Glycine max]